MDRSRPYWVDRLGTSGAGMARAVDTRKVQVAVLAGGVGAEALFFATTDGIGFDTDRFQEDGHLGLSTMTALAAKADGWCSLSTQTGQFTLVEAWLPTSVSTDEPEISVAPQPHTPAPRPFD